MRELNVAKKKLDSFIEDIKKESTNQNFTSSPGSSSSNYFTGEYMEENRDEIDINICEIGKNYGEVKINFGKIDSNYHTINKNHKVVGKNCAQ